MWYYNAEIIKTPKTMIINGLKYGPGLFRDTKKLTELGIKQFEIGKQGDGRYYYLGAMSIDTSGDVIVGNYASVGKDTNLLKKHMLNTIKRQLSTRLTSTDWYYMRKLRTGNDVPVDIQEYSDTLYSEYETKKTEISAMTKLSHIMEYENRKYTQVTKIKHIDDKTAKETYGPETGSATVSINMCTHWTSNPNDNVDPAFVSLTAD